MALRTVFDVFHPSLFVEPINLMDIISLKH